MNIEEIRKARLAEPFRQFSLILEDGTRVPVVRPERIGYSPLGTRVTVFGSGENFRVIDVASIQDLQMGSASKKSNGQAKRSGRSSGRSNGAERQPRR